VFQYRLNMTGMVLFHYFISLFYVEDGDPHTVLSPFTPLFSRL